MRIFLDANILFSAAKTDGAIRALLTLLQNRGHTCVIDAYVLEEARRNLAAKAEGRIAELEKIRSKLEHVATYPTNILLEAALPLPEKDRPVLAAAIQHRCQALVTGDRTHFGKLYGKTIQGVTIHSPKSIAEFLLGL